MARRLKEKPRANLKAEIIEVDFSEELQRSYLEYSLSVILSRALPDVRDGLKPVQRRILWAMYEMGLYPNKPFKKSAAVVGEVLGRYHPHGDSAVYDALVRMAQDFSLRYPLIEGQGNFGSLDGDPPAAYRYTEARLSPAGMVMLKDIEWDTVDFRPNFDNTAKEPVVLPSALPNLLVNGSMGIAVGMSTSIPPHNLSDVVKAISLYIDNPKVSDNELIKAIVGPDFPTGGVIVGTKQLIKAYKTGKSLITLEGKYELEEVKGKRYVIITEIPYGVNKAKLVETIAKAMREKRITGVNDVVDSSDKEGVRIILELKPDAKPEDVINQLRKHTDFRTSFLIQMIAVNGHEPKLYNLRGLIEEYVNHRREVIRRRTERKLEKASAREHILEGLLVLLDALDLAIKLIRESGTVKEAKEKLRKHLKLTEAQANHILSMQLSQLTRTQREEILKELEALRTEIAHLRRILANPKLIDEVIKEELREIEERFASPRRTTFYDKDPYKEVKVKEKVEDVDLWISRDGYYSLSTGGRTLAPIPERAFSLKGRNVDYLLLFSSLGQYLWIPLKKLPETSNKRDFLGKVINISSGERIVGALILPKRSPQKVLKDKNFVVITNKGRIKGLSPEELLANMGSSRRSRYIKLESGEAVSEIFLLRSGSQVLLLNTSSYVLRLDDIPIYGRNAKGVVGMKLKEGEEVFKAWGLEDLEQLDSYYLSVLTADWNLILIPLRDIPLMRRGARGLKLNLNIKDSWLHKENFKLILETMDRSVVEVSKEELERWLSPNDKWLSFNLRRSDLPLNMILRMRVISSG